MPKIIDHDQRRREIIQVAKNIVLKGGFEAATMRTIAAEAGYANGALKHYFPGKESIIAATFESILAELDVVINASSTTDAGMRLDEFLRSAIPQDAEQVAAGRVLLALWEHAMSNEDLAELYRAHLRNWRTAIEERMERAYDAGKIAVPPPYDGWAREYISVVIGGMVVNLIYADGSRIQDYNQFVDEFLRRLGATVAA